MKSNEDIVSLIREQADIVEIIGDYVNLKKKGRNFLGLCPFHTEKTPSFNVSAEKGIYKCFGCGKAGNVFTFLMEYSGMTFPEALDAVAARIGFVIPKEHTKKQQETKSARDLAIKALESAAGFYYEALHAKSGATALQYLHKRGYTQETIKKFSVGFSPNGWDITKKELIHRGISENTLEDAGLIIRREDGSGSYDRFRGRLMFPIRDFLGKFVGFGARQIDNEPDQPKYINSPQSIVYDKSRILYALFEAKNAIRNRGEALLVEGYADTIALHQAGFENAIASSGTALTIEQLKIIARYSKKLIVSYDSDPAGISAAERAIELALPEGFEVLIVELPDGEDPDSLIKGHGANTFKLYLRKASSFVDFKVSRAKSLGHLDSPNGKAETARSLLNMIASIPDRLQHDFFISRMAGLLDISEHQLKTLYSEKKDIEKERKKKDTDRPPEFYSSRKPEPELKDALFNQNKEHNEIESIFELLLPEEIEILRNFISESKKAKALISKYSITQNSFNTFDAIRLFNIILSYCDSSGHIFDSINDSESIDSAIKNVISKIIFYDHPSELWKKSVNNLEEYNVERTLKNSCDRLELKRIDTELSILNKKLKDNNELEIERDLTKRIKELIVKKVEMQMSNPYLLSLD